MATWNCTACTFINATSRNTCEICDSPKSLESKRSIHEEMKHNELMSRNTKSAEKESNLSKWKCSSCLTVNDSSDKNVIPCIKCHILNSETNLYRARCLYLLGNIEKPIASLIPLKTPFFIYPLAPPIVTIRKKIKHNGVWLHFEIDYLHDIQHTEIYHIEQVKFEIFKLSTIHKTKHLDFVIHNLTPYYNIFSKFITNPYCGEFSVDIYAKCYLSNRISPKQTLKFDLLPPKTSSTTKVSTTLNKNKRHWRDHEVAVNKKDILVQNVFYKSPSKRQRIDKQINKMESSKTNQANQDKKRSKLNRLKAKIVGYRNTIINGCGDSQCTNPYCRSNSDNKYKVYSDVQTSKLALKMVKVKAKDCNQFKKRKIIKGKNKKNRVKKQEQKSQNVGVTLPESKVKELFYKTVAKTRIITEVKDLTKNNRNSVIYEKILQEKCNGRKREKMEKLLWHGTKDLSNLNLIIKNGFDRSFNSTARYGKGTYFAKKASYSVENGYCGNDSSGIFSILLCKVIVGDYTTGTESTTIIPRKADGTEYDTLVNTTANPTIFVVWRDYHAVPIYLVKFK